MKALKVRLVNFEIPRGWSELSGYCSVEILTERGWRHHGRIHVTGIGWAPAPKREMTLRERAVRLVSSAMGAIAEHHRLGQIEIKTRAGALLQEGILHEVQPFGQYIGMPGSCELDCTDTRGVLYTPIEEMEAQLAQPESPNMIFELEIQVTSRFVRV